MELQRTQHSSGVAKAGLATGITGLSLAGLNLLTNGSGLLGGLTGMGNPRAAMAYGCCNEDHLVDRYTLALEAKIAEKDTQIALRDANTFTDNKILEVYKDYNARFREIELQLANQAVQNQKVSDSFQMVSERMDCCCKELSTKIDAECNARRCADNTIVNYVNATFYPKMVANVTTGTTTTAQTLFNPLPATNCGSCGCN